MLSAGRTWIVDTGNVLMRLQALCQDHGAAVGTLHSQVQRLHPPIHQERRVGVDDAAQHVVHQSHLPAHPHPGASPPPLTVQIQIDLCYTLRTHRRGTASLLPDPLLPNTRVRISRHCVLETDFMPAKTHIPAGPSFAAQVCPPTPPARHAHHTSVGPMSTNRACFSFPHCKLLQYPMSVRILYVVLWVTH